MEEMTNNVIENVAEVTEDAMEVVTENTDALLEETNNNDVIKVVGGIALGVVSVFVGKKLYNKFKNRKKKTVELIEVEVVEED